MGPFSPLLFPRPTPTPSNPYYATAITYWGTEYLPTPGRL